MELGIFSFGVLSMQNLKVPVLRVVCVSHLGCCASQIFECGGSSGDMHRALWPRLLDPGFVCRKPFVCGHDPASFMSHNLQRYIHHSSRLKETKSSFVGSSWQAHTAYSRSGTSGAKPEHGSGNPRFSFSHWVL